MQTEKTLIHDMTQGSILRQLVPFAIPMILANLLQTLYNTVDMVVVGHFVGAHGLSAVSTGGELLHFFTNLCMGFTAGGQIIISQQVGMGDRKGIRETVGTLFSVIMITSVIFMVLGLGIHEWMVQVLNTPAEAYDQAKSYVFICCLGLPFIFGYNCVSAVLRGMGDSKRPLLFIAIAAVVNLVLDLLMVGVFSWGAAGAAVATVAGQGLSVVCSVVFLYRHRESFGFDFSLESFRIRRDKLLGLLRVGLPLSIQHVAINFSLLFVNAYINSYGVVASAVTGVGNKIQNISSIITNGFNNAGGAMIGQNLGAGKHDRAKRIVYIGLALNAVLCAVNCAVALLFPEQVFSLFSSDAAVLEMAPLYLRIQCWAFIGSALMGPFGAMVTGSGFSTLGLLVGLLDGVVIRLGGSILLGEVLGMGLVGYFYGNALARLGSAAVQMVYFYSGKWRTRKLILER